MTLLTYIFLVSLFGVWFLFFNKMKEVASGKPIVCISCKFDNKLELILKQSSVIIRRLPKQLATNLLHFLVIKFVSLGKLVKALLYSRFSHVIDTVSGKKVPKSQDGVSVFLNSLSSYKKNDSGEKFEK